MIGCIKPPRTLSTKARVQEFSNELQMAKESAKRNESTLRKEVDNLNQELQKSQNHQKSLRVKKEEGEQEIQELQKQVKRLSSCIQVGKIKLLLVGKTFAVSFHKYLST